MLSRRNLAIRLAIGALLAVPSLASADDDSPSLAGKWTWTWKDAQGETHKHVLVLEGEGDKLSGKETFDDKPAVKVEALEQKGKTISFAVDRDGRHAEYKGKLTSDKVIDGNVTVTQGGVASEFGWTASRVTSEK